MPEPIRLFEEHGEVLAHWCARRFRRETVVCFDRHFDLKRIRGGNVERLQAAAEDPAAIASLNRDHPFRDDDTHGYGLDDFLYAAAVLGWIGRLVLVVPERDPRTNRGLAESMLDHLSLVPGHGDEVRRGFHVEGSGPGTRLAGVRIDVTTLRRLPDVNFASDCIVDVDLDFLADSDGTVSHTVDELVDGLIAAHLDERVDSATYSISSGFLPEHMRGVAKDFARRMRRPLDPAGRGPRRLLESTKILSTSCPVEAAVLDDLWTRELEPLGGPGWAMRSVLALRVPDRGQAARCYEEARAAGQRASWVAYRIGLAHLADREYTTAAHWFNRACDGEVADLVEARALVLSALALLRAGDAERGLAAAQRSVELLSARPDAHRVAAAAAEANNLAELAASHRQTYSELDDLLDRAGLE